MPLLLFARLLLSLISLAVLAVGGYLLWSWWDGTWVARVDGGLEPVREPWRLATAVALLAWSFLGRLILLPLIARPDRARDDAPAPSSTATMDSPTGSTLALTETGPKTGPTILLTHGWGLDQTIWRGLARRLAQRYRVLTWDLPGLGASHKPADSGVDLDLFARDLAAILAALNGPVLLVGHSIGGMTIQTLVRENPAALEGKVAGVVLVNTTYTDPLKTMALSGLAQALRWPLLEPSLWLTALTGPLAQLSAWQSYLSGSAHLAIRLGFAGAVTRSQLEQTTLLTTRNPQSISARGNLSMFRWDATGVLAHTAKPLLILAGAQDIVTKPEASRVLASVAPNAQLVVVDNANHMGFLEREAAYAEAIEGFCARTLSPPSPLRASPYA